MGNKLSKPKRLKEKVSPPSSQLNIDFSVFDGNKAHENLNQSVKILNSIGIFRIIAGQFQPKSSNDLQQFHKHNILYIKSHNEPIPFTEFGDRVSFDLINQ